MGFERIKMPTKIVDCRGYIRFFKAHVRKVVSYETNVKLVLVKQQLYRELYFRILWHSEKCG